MLKKKGRKCFFSQVLVKVSNTKFFRMKTDEKKNEGLDHFDV